MTILISVIVPVYNDWDLLRKCLSALSSQSIDPRYFEVIVVNNNPENKAPPEQCFSGNIRLIDQNRPGSYAARNLGIESAKGPYLAFTDADCIPSTVWLASGLKLLQDGHLRVGGRISLFTSSGHANAVELYETCFAFRQDQNVTAGMSVTANLFTHKKLFETLGLFDESLMSGGDTEWGKRATKAGIPIIYSKEAVVSHPARNSFRQIFKKQRRVLKGLVAIAHPDTNLSFVALVRLLAPPLISASNDRFSGLSNMQFLRVYLVVYLLRLHKFYVLATVFCMKKIK